MCEHAKAGRGREPAGSLPSVVYLVIQYFSTDITRNSALIRENCVSLLELLSHVKLHYYTRRVEVCDFFCFLIKRN